MSDLSTATTANLAVRAGAFPSAADALAALTPEQLKRYEDDGYLVLPGFASRDQLLALQERAESIVAEFVPPPARTVFTTSGQEQATDDYMLDSGDKVCCFFEKGALSSDGSLCVDKNKSINKIGHGLHEKDPVFRAYSDSSPLRTLARSLGLRDPRLAQSMYIFKQPRIGGEVGAHQDSSFLYTSPASCVGLWVALDDATEENGCMYAVPGSHKEGLKTRYTLVTEQVTETGADGSTTARTVRKTKFTPPLASAGLKMEGGVCLAVPAGSLVVLHGALVHYSFANLSAQQRHAYTLHIVEGPEYAEWAKDNWMQRDTPFPAFTQ